VRAEFRRRYSQSGRRLAASRLCGIALVAVSVCIASLAQAAPASESAAVVHRLWDKLLTPCGESYFYAGSFFDRQGMASEIGAGQHPSVMEYRGVRFNTVPIRVSDAEKLNGVSYRARVTMIAHVYRSDGGSWANGPDLQPRNMNDIAGQALANVIGDMGQIGATGSIAFELVDFKGKWLVGRSSGVMSGPLTFHTGYYPVDQIQRASAPKYSCAQLGQMVQQTLTAEADADAKQARKEAVDRAWRAEGPTRDAQRGIPALLLSDADVKALRMFYAERPTERTDDSMLFAAEAVVGRYPILPGEKDWLKVGTSFTRLPGLRDINPENGSNRMLMVVALTSGSHVGRAAMIEAENYGRFDQRLPGRVWATEEEARQAERKFDADALEADKILVRDPVRGEPFLLVSEQEAALLQATYQSSRLGNGETMRLQQNLAERFPRKPSDDQWLAPGTQIEPVLFGDPNGSGVEYFSSVAGGKALALIRVETGAHQGELGLIDLRNYASNVHVICPAEPEALACYAPEEAKRRRQQEAKDLAAHYAEAPLLPAREAPWRYSGSMAEFAVRLRANLRLRAAQFDVDPESYNAELEQIVGLVSMCVRITPAEFESAKDQHGIPRLERIGPGFARCQMSNQRISPPRDDAWIVIDTNTTHVVLDHDIPLGQPGAVEEDMAGALKVTVYLYPKDLKRLVGNLYMEDRVWKTGVIAANVAFNSK
jgi:hypothetical protein